MRETGHMLLPMCRRDPFKHLTDGPVALRPVFFGSSPKISSMNRAQSLTTSSSPRQISTSRSAQVHAVTN